MLNSYRSWASPSRAKITGFGCPQHRKEKGEEDWEGRVDQVQIIHVERNSVLPSVTVERGP